MILTNYPSQIFLTLAKLGSCLNIFILFPHFLIRFGWLIGWKQVLALKFVVKLVPGIRMEIEQVLLYPTLVYMHIFVFHLFLGYFKTLPIHHFQFCLILCCLPEMKKKKYFFVGRRQVSLIEACCRLNCSGVSSSHEKGIKQRSDV